MIKAYLIDDEQSAIETLSLMLEKYCKEVEVVATANGIEAIMANEVLNDIDVIFLDINFGEYTGFDILEKVSLTKCKVVFVTAYDQFGIKAIKSGAFDYIVKPVDPEELIQTVNKLLKRRLTFNSHLLKDDSHIIIPVNNTHTRIKLQDIVYVEADGAYSNVHEFDTKYFCSKPLKYFEDLLPKDDFFRIHNSYLVRTDSIKAVKMGRDQPVVLKNGMEIPVARNRKKELMILLEY